MDDENLKSMQDYLSSTQYSVKNDLIVTDQFEFELDPKYSSLLNTLKSKSEYSDPLIYGKDSTLGITAIEIMDDELWLFKNDGSIEKREHYYWVMAPRPLDSHFERLEGNQHYRYIRFFTSKNAYYGFLKMAENRKADVFTIYNSKEAAMIYYGITSYKGLSLDDVAVLAFDIEGAGLSHNNESNVFLITNVFKKNGQITEKHFRLDHFEHAGAMIDAWCNWVQSVDPDIITGHNINGYDLPYLNHVAKLNGTTLKLGKDISEPFFSTKESEYRVDGSQSWTYKRINIFGRQIIDGMFLAVKYDIGRKYSSWGLKAIAQAEGLVKEDRQFYDASLIAKNWSNLEEREKIIKYGLDDAMDSMKLFELMVPSYFMLCKMIPKPFQALTEGASGSWLNSMMVRAYLQDDYSIPKADDKVSFEGAISYGNPGIYSNCFKIDIVSMYPSIIRQYGIYDKVKDPKKYILKMTDYFFTTRVYHKQRAKETNSLYHKAMDGSLKICANSIYGFLGAPGLNFNYPDGAAEVTRKGREILEKTIFWATGKEYKHWSNLLKEEVDENS